MTIGPVRERRRWVNVVLEVCAVCQDQVALARLLYMVLWGKEVMTMRMMRMIPMIAEKMSTAVLENHYWKHWCPCPVFCSWTSMVR